MNVEVETRPQYTFRLIFGAFAVLLTVGSIASGQTQSAAAKSSASQAAGFSIETEMLTYRALESNSQAIACDVAAVISGVKPDFKAPAEGAGCAAPPNLGTTTIVLLPFEKGELEDFAAWAAAMAELGELQDKAASLGCPNAPVQVTKSGTLATALGSFISASPAGPPLALAEGALSLFASQEETRSVGGNIEDLAFMNNVGRQLRALHISVVVPSSYGPETLKVQDQTTSPFLASKTRTLLALGCLSGLTPKGDSNVADIKQAISDIDDYMATLGETKPTKNSGGGAQLNNSGTPGSPSTPSAKAGGGTPTAPTTPTPSLTTPPSAKTATATNELTAILSADGLAQKLGFRFDLQTGKLSQPATGRYVLMLKALESGGSVTGTSNILGTRLRYSGGAVGTYALFAADGDLTCAGNVYDYAGPLSAKHFQRDLRNFHLDPSQQVIIHSGSCPTTGSEAPVVPASNPIR